MPLRTVNVTRYLTPLREGGSLPAIVEADDNNLYVLKFRGAGQGRVRWPAQKAARAGADRRILSRTLSEQWAATDLRPRFSVDGKRASCKGGYAFTQAQFDRRVFSKLGALVAQEIRKADLLAVLETAKADAKLRTGNVLFADLAQMFRFALTRDPVRRIRWVRLPSGMLEAHPSMRDRLLSMGEQKLLLDTPNRSG